MRNRLDADRTTLRTKTIEAAHASQRSRIVVAMGSSVLSQTAVRSRPSQKALTQMNIQSAEAIQHLLQRFEALLSEPPRITVLRWHRGDVLIACEALLTVRHPSAAL